MRRRVLRVELNRYASLVSGPGAHELIRESSDRLPVWISTLRGFSVSEETARDVIAAAEVRGYDDDRGPGALRASVLWKLCGPLPLRAGPSRVTRAVVAGDRGRRAPGVGAGLPVPLRRPAP